MTYETELNIDIKENETVHEVIKRLADDEKVNIILQSFIVGAGSIEAHDMYVYYLCQVFSLTPREGGLLLRKCFSTLDEDHKKIIVGQAYRSHLDQMKKSMRETKRQQIRNTEFKGNFQAALQTTEENLPTILGNKAFDDITQEEMNLVKALPKDFSPNMENRVIVALRKISDARGYYDNRKWKQAELEVPK